MFTIKYRFYTLAAAQSSEGPLNYDECESVHGPYEVVSQERQDGLIVVHGIDPAGQLMTFGPHRADEQRVAGQPAPRPIIWVMNENGATISRYDL